MRVLRGWEGGFECIKLNQAHCNKASFKDQQLKTTDLQSSIFIFFILFKAFHFKMNKLFINLLDKLIFTVFGMHCLSISSMHI